MNSKNCNSEIEQTEKKNRGRRIWVLTALGAGVVLILILLLIFTIFRGSICAPDDKVGNPLFYTKNGKVYYTSTDEIAPVEVISPNEKVLDRSFSYYDVFSIQVSKDGRKLFYPNNIDLNNPEYNADIFCCNLASKNHDTIKVGSGINNYVPNQDGSKVYFLKNKDLYVSDLSNIKKIAAGIEEFCINKEGDLLMYVTLDSRLFQYTESYNEVKEIASNAKLHYASADLKTIYYLKDNSLYLLKDGKDAQMIVSDVASVLNIYEDGSLYYLKAHPIIMSDYVNDDMAASDAKIKEPNESDYPDRKSYIEACNRFMEKNARDDLRQLLKTDRIEEINTLYYYANRKSTIVSEYCGNVWKDTDKIKLMPYHSLPVYCGNDRPLLIYYQFKAQKINMSDVTDYTDIYNDIMNSLLNNQETYVCSGSEVLKKIADKKPDQLEYDIGNNKIYYAVNHYDDKFHYDLFDVVIDGSKVSEARKYAENVQLPNYFSVGGSVIYLKSDGSNHLGGDLYVNNEKIDSHVDHSVCRIENTHSFIYATDYKKGTYTLKLYQDGKITKISDNVSLYQYFDDNRTAYVVGTPVNDTAKLYLYDFGSQASQLVDSGMSGIFSPVKNFYYGYNRSTYPME